MTITGGENNLIKNKDVVFILLFFSVCLNHLTAMLESEYTLVFSSDDKLRIN